MKTITKTNENQVFAYEFGLKNEIKFCVVHTNDPKIINTIKFDWNFFHTSNIAKKRPP